MGNGLSKLVQILVAKSSSSFRLRGSRGRTLKLLGHLMRFLNLFKYKAVLHRLQFFFKFLSEFSCRLDTKFSSEGGEAVGQLIYRMNAYIWGTQKHMSQLEDTVYVK